MNWNQINFWKLLLPSITRRPSEPYIAKHINRIERNKDKIERAESTVQLETGRHGRASYSAISATSGARTAICLRGSRSHISRMNCACVCTYTRGPPIDLYYVVNGPATRLLRAAVIYRSASPRWGRASGRYSACRRVHGTVPICNLHRGGKLEDVPADVSRVDGQGSAWPTRARSSPRADVYSDLAYRCRSACWYIYSIRIGKYVHGNFPISRYGWVSFTYTI